MVKDNIDCAFPYADISLRIFFTLMVTNSSAECSFSQWNHMKNPNGTTMIQEELDSLSLLMIESDFLRKFNFDDIFKHFTRHKSRKKL